MGSTCGRRFFPGRIPDREVNRRYVPFPFAPLSPVFIPVNRRERTHPRWAINRLFFFTFMQVKGVAITYHHD
jgi:hypothetical protein